MVNQSSFTATGMLTTFLYSLLLIIIFSILTCDCGNEELLHDTEVTPESRKLNILILTDPPMGHLARLLAVGEELARRAHNVTLLVALNESDQDKYKKHVEKHGVHLWNISFEDLSPIDMNEHSKDVSNAFFWTMITEVRYYLAGLAKIMAKHVNRTLSAGEWDIVIGYSSMQILMSCMHSSHKTPSVFIPNVALASSVDPPWPWPSFMYGASSDDFGFVDRAKSIPYKLAYNAFLYVMLSPSVNGLAEYCPSVSLSQVLTDSGVNIPVILPTVIGFEHPRTISSMTEYVGPLLFTSPAPLSGELEEWLKSKSDRSVVYVSMGSMFNLDREGGKALLEGVMKTNYSLLWSLRKSNQWILEGLDVDPDRVMISDWTPQFSVLGSKATHSAILHGGFNGLSEALWNGVPVIVLPQMVEQLYNAGRVHFNGLGIHLDANTLSSSKIAESLRALDTGEYRSKVAKLQKAFRIAGGAKRAADLVEFYEDVGYAHLVPAYAKYQWSWVQYYNADVHAVMVLILAILIICLATCCKCICGKCFCTRKEKKD